VRRVRTESKVCPRRECFPRSSHPPRLLPSTVRQPLSWRTIDRRPKPDRSPPGPICPPPATYDCRPFCSAFTGRLLSSPGPDVMNLDFSDAYPGRLASPSTRLECLTRGFCTFWGRDSPRMLLERAFYESDGPCPMSSPPCTSTYTDDPTGSDLKSPIRSETKPGDCLSLFPTLGPRL